MRLRCLLLVFGLHLPAAGDNSALDRWLARQATIRSVEVAFTQTRTLPALKKPVTTPGKLAFEKPGKVRWELGDPPTTLAISDGSELVLIDRKAGTARRIAADSPQAARFTMLSGRGFQGAADFHKAFEVVAHRIDSGIHQYTLKPLDRSMRGQVPWVFLSIDPASGDLRALEVELKDKSRIRSVFGKPVVNGRPSPDLFRAELDGLKIK